MAALCCVNCGRGVSLTLGGADHVVVDDRGKRWLFEMHPFCGPIVLRRDGAPAARQPGSRSPFWPPFERWLVQSKPQTMARNFPTAPPAETAR